MIGKSVEGTPNLSKIKLEFPKGYYQPESFRSKDSLGYLLRRAFFVLAGTVDTELAPYELTYPQFVILLRLAEGDCTTVSELAREVGTDIGAMTRMINRLESKNIVRRVRASHDRRMVTLEITETAAKLAEKVVVVAINVLNRYFKDFSVAELNTLESFLRRVIDAAKQSDL